MMEKLFNELSTIYGVDLTGKITINQQIKTAYIDVDSYRQKLHLKIGNYHNKSCNKAES